MYKVLFIFSFRQDPLDMETTDTTDPVESILSIVTEEEETVIEDPAEQKPICDLDNLVLHLESLQRRSPQKVSRRKKTSVSNTEEESLGEIVDEKPLLVPNDDVGITSLLDEMIDKVGRNDVPLSNLVFSTLGRVSSGEVRESDDISAYLESSSSESSRSPSPDPILHHDLNLDDNQENPDYSSNMIGSDDNENIPNLSKECIVNVEKLKLTEDQMKTISYYLKPESKPSPKPCEVPVNTKIRKKFLGTKLRSKRCGQCYACDKPDCRSCLFCRDMKKYGGKGVKKQSCLHRPPCTRARERSTKTSVKQSDGKKNLRSKKVAEPVLSTKIASEVKSRQVRRSSVEERGESSTRKTSGSNPLVERPKLNKYATVNGTEDLVIRKNKMDQIKEKFKLQEKALKGGKTSLLNLSKEELLFGFHL